MKAIARRIFNLWVLALGGFAALAASASDPVRAADAAATEGQLQEVVVTAEYRDTKLQDTPIAITAITPAQIDAQGATRLTEILNDAPSVFLRPQSAAFGESVVAYIRGFGQADFDPAFEPGVGLYIDDVYYPRLTGANFDLLDVERVEVLRGPQGTLYGRNSEGGAIRFVTRKPTGDGGGYVSVTYGSGNRINLRASSDFKLADNFTGRISGTYASQDGYVDVYDYGCSHPGSGVPSGTAGLKCKQYSLGDVGYTGARGILRYNPSDKLDITFSADYERDRHNNGAEVLLYANNPNPNVTTPNGLPFDSRFLCGPWCNYTTTGQAAASWVAGAIPPLQGFPVAATSGTQLDTLSSYDGALNIGIGLSDAVKLASITGYRNWTNEFSIDGDLSPAQTQFGNNILTDWFWSQELRLSVDVSKSLRFTTGAYYSDEKTTYYTLQDIRYVAIALPFGPLPLFPLQFIGNDPVHTNSRAAFGTLFFDVSDALKLNGGLRYTKDYKSYTYYRLNLDGTTINTFLDPTGALNGHKAAFDGSRTDWHVGADYRFNPEVMAYLSIGTGYKAGGDSPRPFNAAQAIGFGPEKLTTYELGLKTDLLNRTLRFNAAVFYNDFKDAQLVLLSCPQFGGPGPCALPQNAGNAKVKGVEVEIQAAPVAGLQFDAAGSYLKWDWDCVNPEVVGLANGPCSSDPAVISLLAPTPIGFTKEQYHAGVQYQIPLAGAGTLTPRLDVVYTGPSVGADLAAAPGSPSAIYGQNQGYTVANFNMTWANVKKDLQATLEVSNLFNKYYFYSKFDLTGAGQGAIVGAPGRPLEVALNMKKSF
jgi:iron complex outermembrane recepter protein